MRQLLFRLPTGKLQTDIAYNIASFTIMALAGVALNVLIGWLYGAAALGMFNQVLASYIIFSQFAALGVQFSLSVYTARHAADPRQCKALILAGLALTACLAAASTAIFWMCRPAVAAVLASPSVAVGMAWATPGLFFFALNKSLFGIANGLRRMKLYALGQALRFSLMPLAVVRVYSRALPAEAICLALSVAEIATFLFLLGMLAHHFGAVSAAEVYCWIKVHLTFGVKSFAAGALYALNSRVDVLMLGYFASDRIVGLFSFAAMLAEGVFQLLVAVRRNFNPLLARYTANHDLEGLQRLISKGKLAVYSLMVIVCISGIVVYPMAIAVLTGQSEFAGTWGVFAILMCGIMLCAGYVPLCHILLQADLPGLHTIVSTCVVLFNVIANCLLIPTLGLYGAALATTMALGFQTLAVKIVTQRRLGVSL